MITTNTDNRMNAIDGCGTDVPAAGTTFPLCS